MPSSAAGVDDLVVRAVAYAALDLATAPTAAGWMAADLVLPDSAARGALRPLDQIAGQGAGTLVPVARQPHERLDRVHELVRAYLARRVPPAGLSRLAARTADWAGVDRGRIVPARVLTQRYTEDLDFYENRVAATLVDLLGRYLSGRIAELGALHRELADLSDLDEVLKVASHRRRERYGRLMDRLLHRGEVSLGAIEAHRDTLRRAKARVDALRGTPLFRGADHRGRLPVRLRRTNLFTGDQRYRRVGDLWEQWAVRAGADTAEQQEATEGFAAGYLAYLAAVSLRAMDALGYQPTDPDAPVSGPGAALRLANGIEELDWTIGADRVELRAAGRLVASVLACDNNLSAPVPEPERASWLATLAGLQAGTIVGYPGRSAERAALSAPVRQRLHPAVPGAGPRLVPVNPLEVQSEERLARALRWAVFGDRLVAVYPPAAELSGPAPRQASDWYRPTGPRSLLLTRPPEPAEYTELIRLLLAAAWNTQRGRPAPVVEPDLTALTAAIESFDVLRCCPVCSTPGAPLRAWDRDTFQCTCPSERQHATWGLRACRACKRRYPVLWERRVPVDQASGDAVVHTAGPNVLALPCLDPTRTRGSRFRCPWCGHCPGHPHCPCPMPPAENQPA